MMEKPRVSNPENIIIISKQAFCDKMLEIGEIFAAAMGEDIIHPLAMFMGMLTTKLFEAEADDEG